MPTISQLPAATTVESNDLLPTVQNGVTKNTTPELLLSFFLANLTPGNSNAPTFSGASINGQGHLILSRSDGVNLDVGSVVGPAGTGIAGPGFTGATVTNAGHLVLTRTDGTTLDLGNVSTTLKLGTTLTQASDGTVNVAGSTPDSLTAADPTTVGTGTLVITVGGVDQKTTPAALVAGQGATPDSLTAADPTAIGGGTLVVTVGTVDKKTTGAALVASQTTTIDALQVISPLSLSDEIAIWDVSAGVVGKVTLSALQALLGTTSSGGSNTGSGGTTSAPTNATAPTISGTPQVGQTLTSSQGSWNNSPTSYAYQWSRAGAAISGATGSTYSPVSADVGTTLTVTVTATNAGGSTSATSGATATVTAASSGSGTAPTYQPLVFDSTPSFDTTTPIEGAATYNSPNIRAVASNFDFGTTGNLCVELRVRAPNNNTGDSSGDWLKCTDSAGNTLGINTQGTGLRAVANGNNSPVQSGANLFDGYNGHLITLNFTNGQLCVANDGGYHQTTVNGSWVGGIGSFAIYGGIAGSAPGIDVIRISNTSRHPAGEATYDSSTYTGARLSDTNTCYNFNQQDGRGS